MKIAAMLRVKNEGRWLAEVLAAIKPLTEHILVFDDHSTDNTRDIASAAGVAVVSSPYPVDATDETRDKNAMLYAVQMMMSPEWVLCIDGDEVLERGAADKIRAKLLPGVSVLSFPIRYVWNDRDHYRADGVYARFQRASMFRFHPNAQYASSLYGCNFHCGNIPAGLTGSGATVPADILHLGYMHREDRLRKYDWYRKKDPNNAYEDGYRHMVIGDIFPEESKFLHGGPLKIFSLPASKWMAIG